MRINEYGQLLEKALPNKRRVLAVGKPGVGKSFMHSQVCRRLGWDYIPLCSPLQSPVKIGGYPRPPETVGGDATHCLFDGIAKAFRAERPTYLVFDDLGMAGGETLKAIVDLIQFGRIDNRVMPDCVVIGGATNDVGHGADVQGLIEPLKTRWHTIVTIETHVDDVVGYGLANDWPAWLCAYLRNSPAALHDWKPSKSMHVDGACPRGWEYVALWDNDGIDDLEVWSGCVGKGRASEASAFKRLQADLPDLNECLARPDSAPVPENPSAKYLVSMALASKMNGKTFEAAIRYLARLDPPLFRICAIMDGWRVEQTRIADKTLPKGYVRIVESPAFTKWAIGAEGVVFKSTFSKYMI